MEDQIFNTLIEFAALQKDETGYILPFKVLRSSSIFDGHFPEQPILPGVAMVELVHRAAEVALAEKLVLKSAGNYKFLAMIDPDKVPAASLVFSISTKDEGWRVKAQIKNDEYTFFKADAFYLKK